MVIWALLMCGFSHDSHTAIAGMNTFWLVMWFSMKYGNFQWLWLYMLGSIPWELRMNIWFIKGLVSGFWQVGGWFSTIRWLFEELGVAWCVAWGGFVVLLGQGGRFEGCFGFLLDIGFELGLELVLVLNLRFVCLIGCWLGFAGFSWWHCFLGYIGIKYCFHVM